MMSNQKNLKIMKRLANDPILEMNNDDLEQLLEAELAKPANEIDSSLVNEILDALNAPEPTPEQMEASWKVVKATFPRQAKATIPQATLRFSAIAAAIIMIMFVTLRDAEAFRWTLIEKILKPVAETFGIVIDDQESIIPEDNEPTLYSIEDAPSEYIEYSSIEDVPETAQGYLIRPKRIPNGYIITNASMYSNPDISIYSLNFENSDNWFSLNIDVLNNPDAIYSHEFERNLEIPVEVQIGQHNVTIYDNAKDKYLSAFWIYENAYYYLSGNLNVAEVIGIIESME